MYLAQQNDKASEEHRAGVWRETQGRPSSADGAGTGAARSRTGGARTNVAAAGRASGAEGVPETAGRYVVTGDDTVFDVWADTACRSSILTGPSLRRTWSFVAGRRGAALTRPMR